MLAGYNTDGYYDIDPDEPDFGEPAFTVYCNMKGGGRWDQKWFKSTNCTENIFRKVSFVITGCLKKVPCSIFGIFYEWCNVIMQYMKP